MAHFLLSFKEKALDAVTQLQSICCQPAAKIKVNGRSFQIIRVLGEGGFSFVYLAQDVVSGRQFALKKIRCPTGNEGVKEAMREVEAYRRFKHPNIIRILDSAVVQDRDGDGQIVYLFLPFYRRGNLQDIINSNSINGTHLPEKEALHLFRGTCLAVRAMHDYHAPITSSSTNGRAGASSTSTQRQLTPSHEEDGQGEHESHGLLPHPSHDQEDDASVDPDNEGEGEGYTYPSGASVPLVSKRMQQETEEVIFDGDEQTVVGDSESSGKGKGKRGEHVPYAHRDLKPANIMIDDGGEPILMDFGSATRARVEVTTRQQALTQQDIAAEQSTMPYRAPELFDVKTNTVLDEKVDIWSLGCTLFATAYGYSPFETPTTIEQGGSVAMAVLNAQYKYPNGGQPYSQGFRKLIDMCLKVDPVERPSVHQLIEETDKVLGSLGN